MKFISRHFFSTTLFLVGSLFATSAQAFNVIISGAPSTNGSFVNNVWTPTADSNLSYGDLLAALAGGDVEIITNGSGDITVNPVFTYTHAFNRQLTLSAEGGVIINGIGSGGSGSLSVVASADGPVEVGGAGMVLNDGAFTSSGTDFTSGASGITTGGGDILLNHTGTVTCTNGGTRTNGGAFTSSGTDFFGSGASVTTDGGDFLLNHTGNVSIVDNGIPTGGGSFTSYGADFYAAGTGVRTEGGDIDIRHTGDATFFQGGAQSNGGSIFVESGGMIEVDVNTTEFTSGGTNNGGNITLRSATGITIDPVISTAPGNGGVLSLQGITDAVTLNETPELGQGSISLYVGPLFLAVPTLAEWGRIILGMLLLVAALTILRARKLA